MLGIGGTSIPSLLGWWGMTGAAIYGVRQSYELGDTHGRMALSAAVGTLFGVWWTIERARLKGDPI